MKTVTTPFLPNAMSEDTASASDEEPQLSADQRSELLRLARTTLTTYLERGCIPDYETTDPALNRQAGVFVTLWTIPTMTLSPDSPAGCPESPALTLKFRGCMGHTPADLPLCEAVQQVTVTTATADPRVWPLKLEELPHTLIEISILSPLRRLTDVDQLQIGRHGLLIIQGHRRGLLLPEVASRSGWDQFEFLDNVCLKAGLPPDSWPEAEIYIFTTEKFGEVIK